MVSYTSKMLMFKSFISVRQVQSTLLGAKDNAEQIEDVHGLRLYGLVGETELCIQFFIFYFPPHQEAKSFENQGLWIFLLNIDVFNV